MAASRAICATLASLTIFACSATNPHIILHAVAERFRFYECVPLGWVPVARDGTYYRGYSAELDETYWWVPPPWAGRIDYRELNRPDVQTTFQVLNELSRAGMLERATDAAGSDYHLRLSAMPYYLDDNSFGNNPAHNSFLCYSKIVPERVAWVQPGRDRRFRGDGDALTFRAAVEWSPGPIPAWANNVFVRRHSLILPPRGPIVADFLNLDGTWEIRYKSDTMLPRIGFVDASVWPRSQ